MVRVQPFAMERMMSKRENLVQYNLSESGVHPLSVREFVQDPQLIDRLLTTPLRYTQASWAALARRQYGRRMFSLSTPVIATASTPWDNSQTWSQGSGALVSEVITPDTGCDSCASTSIAYAPTVHTLHLGYERRQRMSKPASDAIARDLRRMIITGELAPGGLVSEVQLSKTLGCSRTPLREALQQLSQQYLLTLPPRRGVLIQPLSIMDCQEIHDVMYDIGSACIARVSSLIGPQQLERLCGIVARQEEASNNVDCYELTELDVEFHTAIAQCAGNRYLVYSTERIQSALARFLYPAYKAAGGARTSIAEHNAIIDALEKGDSELANVRLREHVTNGRERVLDILGRGDDRHDSSLGNA